MTELRTDYLGLELANPIVASAGPLTGQLDSLRTLVEAGVGAVVLPSLFEEEVERAVREHDRFTTEGTETFAEALSYLPTLPVDPTGIDRHVELVAAAARELPVPVIASLNGTSLGGWTDYARTLVDAGAAALELNVYAPAVAVHDVAESVERRTADLVAAVRAEVPTPLAVKLLPYYTAVANVAARVVEAGADGLVLFNRFAQPDLDLETLTVHPRLSLSTPDELRLRLQWIALLRGRVDASLAASGGVHDPHDVVRVLLAGGDVAMTTSALLRHGPGRVRTLLSGLTDWLTEHDYESVAQMRGSMSAQSVPDPDAYARAGYVETIRDATRRHGSADDAGTGALRR